MSEPKNQGCTPSKETGGKFTLLLSLLVFGGRWLPCKMCDHISLLCSHWFLFSGFLPFLPLIRTFAIGYRAHLDNLRLYNLKIFNLIISTNTFFPNKVTFTEFRELDQHILGGRVMGEAFNPLYHHSCMLDDLKEGTNLCIPSRAQY